ncbi:MAG: hypothetical protein HY042_12090, partial [Spirochaetia bacterium]|nr:hypothetical protein [Spirochaetia bacterium]
MAKKPAKKSAKRSTPKRSTGRSAAKSAASSASPVREPEYSPAPAAPMAEEQESRSPVTGLLIMAVPVLIAVLLVVYRDKIWSPTPSGSQETSMRSDDKKPADAKKEVKKDDKTQAAK